jgi:hypothetical protein
MSSRTIGQACTAFIVCIPSGIGKNNTKKRPRIGAFWRRGLSSCLIALPDKKALYSRASSRRRASSSRGWSLRRANCRGRVKINSGGQSNIGIDLHQLERGGCPRSPAPWAGECCSSGLRRPAIGRRGRVRNALRTFAAAQLHSAWRTAEAIAAQSVLFG